MNKAVLDILNNGSKSQIKALFVFDRQTEAELIRQKFLYWSRYFFPKFFSSPDASFHQKIDEGNIGVYKNGGSFLDVAYRDSAKTTRTKLFIGFVVVNDEDHYRKYIKVLSKDLSNAKQSTTDVYNMLVSRKIKALYSEIFQKTDTKREETMASFTTATGVKMVADSIGTGQRGDIQDESRPDFVWYDDFEDRLSLMSAQITHKIWENMEEARTGLAKDGGSVYTCNYISERGNVHKLVEKIENKIIVPIEENGEPTWARFTKDDIAKKKKETEDYEGEYLCKPSASKDVYFDRASLDKQISKQPIDEIAGLKIYRKYDPSHRIGSGHDVGAGVGLDSSTSVFMDFDVIPIQVVATYKNNEVKPDTFAYEIARQGKRFGENYVAVEKNYGSTLDILKTIYPLSKIHKTHREAKIVFQAPLEYGWECVMPDSKILTSNLNWIEASLLKVGDKIIGPTEEGIRDGKGVYHHRYFINQTIIGLKLFKAKIIKVNLSDGRIIRFSNNHPFLVKCWDGGPKWIKAEELRVGSKIYAIPTWTPNKSFEAGRLSGLLCGEGFITFAVNKKLQRPNGLNMMISQVKGELAEEILNLWRITGFEPNRKYTRHKDRIKEQTMTYTGVGNSLMVLKALGTIRPTRLLNKFIRKNLIEAISTRAITKLSVEGIEIESQKNKVIGIETSGHTLIVDGLLSHNTNVNTKNIMLTAFSQAVENGLIDLNDKDLIAEAKGYTLNDLMDREVDPRLTTRHFDLLMAACIAYQTNSFIKKPTNKVDDYPWSVNQQKKPNEAR